MLFNRIVALKRTPLLTVDLSDSQPNVLACNLSYKCGHSITSARRMILRRTNRSPRENKKAHIIRLLLKPINNQ